MAYLTTLHLAGAVVRIAAFNVLLLASCGYALWRGGPPERIAACCFLLSAAMSAILVSPLASRFHHLEKGLLAVDLFVFAVMVLLSYSSERFWPIWMCGLQSVEVGTHLAALIAPGIVARTYSEAVTLWAYPMILLLAIGTMRHRRRLDRYGADGSWKT